VVISVTEFTVDGESVDCARGNARLPRRRAQKSCSVANEEGNDGAGDSVVFLVLPILCL